MATSDDIQRLAKTLSDPTRFQIYKHIAESTEPVAVAELTEMLGLNHNAIRQHLAVLEENAMVVGEREVRSRPGRPRLLYSVRHDALHDFGDASRSYKRLASLLVEVAQTGLNPYDVGRRAVEKQSADRGDVERVAFLMHQLTVEGFEPRSKGKLIVLTSCPFADVASQGPSVVCELHRGLIDGYLGESVPLKVCAPHKAGCEITLPPAASS